MLARQEASENFELARHGGSWMVVTGFLAALLWVGGVTSVALGYFGVPALQAMNPWLLAGAGMATLIPAILIIMAGYMGRTNRRATASNALVMEAAVRLMAPAREAGSEGITFAEQMKQAAAEVDKAMSRALTTMKAMSGEIGDERHRLEQVAYASADNARDLTQRLAAERQSLEGLARELRTQLQQMNEAIPRQAQMMVEIARQAGDEVARADDALEGRLISMQSASHALAEKLVDLDHLASDAAARTEALTFAIARIEEKLDQSRRMVDSAVRAGEIAAAAAMTTGDALKEAVATAIDGARAASHEITESSRSASEEAARSLARLRQAGEDAAAALRGTGSAARDEVARMERSAAYEPRPAPPPAVTRPAPAPTPAPAPPPVRTAPPPAQASAPANGHGHSNGYGNGQPERREPAPTPPPPRPEARPETRLEARPEPRPEFRPEPKPKPSMPDDDLFDAAADLIASESLRASEGSSDRLSMEQAPLELGRTIDPKDPNPLTLRRRFDDVQDEPTPPPHPMRRKSDFEPRQQAAPEPSLSEEPAAPPPKVVPPASAHEPPQRPATANGSEMGWRDIISDMSREDPPRDREDVADTMIQRLQSSGIQLPEAFRPKAKRKIAEAARRGDKQRKAATIEQAGRQVERVTQRLRNDDALMDLARSFVEMEQEDALNALEQTQKTSRNASPRLAAYLLLDAAL
ncbi:MAG: hypothetical protein R3B98_07790 [Hyphomonas sp.]